MKIFGTIVGFAALVAAGSANAAIVYDTITGEIPTNGYKPLDAANRGPLGDSFIATNSERIESVTFMVKENANDTGSVLVYLVPNNPATGAPTLPAVSGGTALSGAQLLGTISGSGLFATFGNHYTAVSLSPDVTVAAGTYWIEMVDANSLTNGDGNPTVTNLQWGFNTSGFTDVGVPTSGNISSYANASDNGLTGPALGNSSQLAVFEMQISTPEPASLAVLGVGTAGLGFIRRRHAKKIVG
jgi:hypothetical protein